MTDQDIINIITSYGGGRDHCTLRHLVITLGKENDPNVEFWDLLAHMKAAGKIEEIGDSVYIKKTS